MAEETGVGTQTDQTPASGSRVRSALVWLGSRGAHTSSPAIEPVVRAVRANHPRAETTILERAYVVAENAHRGQLRKSGDPYITHPVAVATILAELGMTPPTLAAALLHDTVEDTSYSLDQLRTDFGDEIAGLVDGVTKLDKVTYGEAAQAETVRKMVIAMARDIRVLVIKLADRLHNARTWKYVSERSAAKKARETLEIYAPLAHRLGMNTIKWELEDLSFATLYPKVYDEIVHLVAERAPAREEYLGQVRDQVLEDLKTAKLKGTVTGRPKHYYSIYQKMIVRGRDFTDIYDLVGLRVLVDSVRDCYAALGVIHNHWNPVPGRFKDYIAMPKFNMYQSLHTTVIELASPSRSRSAATTCTDAPSTGSRRTGSTRRTARRLLTAAVPTTRCRGCVSWSTGSRRLPTPASSWTRCGSGDLRLRGLRLHPEGRCARRCPPSPARWTRQGLRGAHGGRPPDGRRTCERPAGAAGLDPAERRHGRGVHLQGGWRRAESGLALVRQEPARSRQDPALVHQGTPPRRRSRQVTP